MILLLERIRDVTVQGITSTFAYFLADL